MRFGGLVLIVAALVAWTISAFATRGFSRLLAIIAGAVTLYVLIVGVRHGRFRREPRS